MWFFKRKKEDEKKNEKLIDIPDFSFLGTDFHSHLIAGVDDGAPNWEDSYILLKVLKDLGYKKVITSPHVYFEMYNNSKIKLLEKFEDMKRFMDKKRLGLELGIAAEYFLDGDFLPKILPQGLLTFGNNQVLVEVSMAGWPQNLDSILFEIQALGYNPVMAHPERYIFENNPDNLFKIKEKGVKFQLNTLAAMGYYGKNIKKLADQYLDLGLYDYCATDLHHERHAENLTKMVLNHQDIMNKLYHYPFKNMNL